MTSYPPSEPPPSRPPASAPGVFLEGHRLDEIVREVPRSTIVGDPAVRVFGVRHDSRTIVPGELFVARRGAQYDGTKYVQKAIDRGAVAILAQRGHVSSEGLSVPLLEVDDIAEGLAFAAAVVYGHPSFSLEVVGITGTNGKTTTCHLVRALVDGYFGASRCGFMGTVGHSFGSTVVAAEHTTPEADEVARVMARFHSEGATHLAMEASSIALTLGRVKAVRFRVAAFTNLTQDHLDFHGSMAAYADAKASLFDAHGPGAAVVNIDSEFGRELASRVRAPLVTVSRSASEGNAHIAPVSVTFSQRGMEGTLRTPQGTIPFQSPLVGAHNLENLVVALGVVHALDLDLRKAMALLPTISGAQGRLERCDGPADDIVVLVDYAHTPDALDNVLASVRAGKASVPGARLICVFGCGGDRDPSKRGPMGQAAGRGADICILTNDNPRTEAPQAIAAAVEKGLVASGKHRVEPSALGEGTYAVELSRDLAIGHAVAQARPGDTVIVAGKGHENYQIVGNEVRPFDDVAVAKAALALRRQARGEGL